MNKALRWLLYGHSMERAGFYVVLDLIGLYANEKLGWSTSQASFLGGLIGGIAYAGPLFGGVISDRIGRNIALLAGALALFVSYVSLSVGAPLFLMAMCLAIGNGLYKPSVTAACGSLSEPSQRQTSFYNFYIATNVGALAAPVIGEIVRLYVGWSLTFGISAACVGITTLIARSDVMQTALRKTHESRADIATSGGLFRASETTLYKTYAAAAIFWCAFSQFNGSLTFYARDWVDRHLLWFVIPPAIFAALNSLFVIVLGERVPLALKKLGVSFRSQLTSSMLIIALGFCAVLYSASRTEPGTASMWYLICIYFAMTVSELMISPAIMTLISHAAPRHKQGKHMGFWFTANAAGYVGSGAIGALKGVIGYNGVFLLIVIMCCCGAAIMSSAAKGITETE